MVPQTSFILMMLLSFRPPLSSKQAHATSDDPPLSREQQQLEKGELALQTGTGIRTPCGPEVKDLL